MSRRSTRTPIPPKPPDTELEKTLVRGAAPTRAFRDQLRSCTGRIPELSLPVLRNIVSALDPALSSRGEDVSALPHRELVSRIRQILDQHQASDSPWDEMTTEEEEQDQVPQQIAPQRPEGYTFGQALGCLKEGWQLAHHSIAQAMTLVQLLQQGHQPSTEDLSSLERALIGTQGFLQGSRIGLEFLDESYKHEKAVAVTRMAAEANLRPGSQGDRSYAQVAQEGPPPQPVKSIRRMEMLRRRKEAFGQERRSKRADDRAFRIQLKDHSGPLALGVVARSFQDTFGFPKAQHIIEDVRKDNRNNFYVQIAASHFETVKQKILAQRDGEDSLYMKDLGLAMVGDPRVSLVAGMVPIAISRIDKHWKPENIMEELWTCNKEKWGLEPSSPMEQHLRMDRRLNQRNRSGEGDERWVASSVIKCWVSQEVYHRILQHGEAVKFDFQIKEARKFQERTRTEPSQSQKE